jgi:hypothetical protein
LSGATGGIPRIAERRSRPERRIPGAFPTTCFIGLPPFDVRPLTATSNVLAQIRSRALVSGLLDRRGRTHSDQERRASQKRDIPIEPPVRNGENGNTTLQENFSYPKLCYVRNDPGLAIDAETTDAQTPEECAAEIDEDGSPVNPIPATPGAPHLPLSQYAKAYPDWVKALGDAPGTLVVAGFMGDA